MTRLMNNNTILLDTWFLWDKFAMIFLFWPRAFAQGSKCYFLTTNTKVVIYSGLQAPKTCLWSGSKFTVFLFKLLLNWNNFVCSVKYSQKLGKKNENFTFHITPWHYELLRTTNLKMLQYWPLLLWISRALFGKCWSKFALRQSRFL